MTSLLRYATLHATEQPTTIRNSARHWTTYYDPRLRTQLNSLLRSVTPHANEQPATIRNSARHWTAYYDPQLRTPLNNLLRSATPHATEQPTTIRNSARHWTASLRILNKGRSEKMDQEWTAGPSRLAIIYIFHLQWSPFMNRKVVSER